jgi:hypothetical protein
MAEINQLARRHWQAVGGTDEYRPDYSRYVRLEQAGMLHVLLGRAHSGVIGGYLFLMVSPHIHTQKTVGQDLGIYLAPRYRNIGNLKSMFDTAEQLLYAKGATTFEVVEPGEGPGARLGLFLRRRRYHATRTVYELRFKR